MEGKVWTVPLWSDTSRNGLGVKEQPPTPRGFQAAGEVHNNRNKGSWQAQIWRDGMSLGLGAEEECAVLVFSTLNKRAL